MNLDNLFLDYCEKQKFDINTNQVETINKLQNFINKNKFSILDILISKKNKKYGFYLYGDVGVGKTMLLNFFFENIKLKKLRLHFNEFMLNFHDTKFKNENRENFIDYFVKDLKKKVDLIYFDEFQVTNIVDAMILGKLFEKIFEQKIIVLFSSNIKIDDLYKDGLQRDQFKPFIQILKNLCIEHKLYINQDYRLLNNSNERYLSPYNSINNFKKNKFLREISKGKNKSQLSLEVKGRNFLISNYYEGIAVFEFDELCNKAVGAEDYIEISKKCNFIFIENIPDFDEFNFNQQQRLITLIDILYEKKIPLMVIANSHLNEISSSKGLEETFKRTKSRLHELTSVNIN